MERRPPKDGQSGVRRRWSCKPIGINRFMQRSRNRSDQPGWECEQTLSRRTRRSGAGAMHMVR